jgi:solute carrier family 39 (zinc transporter), member 1/2/3
MLGIGIKLLASFVILVIALVGGLFPILIRATKKTKSLLLYGESFAGGVFLGAGLIHLLPEAQENLHAVYPGNYPYIFAICAFAILFLRLIEDGVTKLFKHNHNVNHICLACLLTVMLSIHSILAGAALGVETAMASFLVIFVAIIAHKGSAAFALGVQIRKSDFSKAAMVQLMLLFSLMTPIGILCGSILANFLQASNGHLAAAIFDAIAAGTFIYIAAFHGIKPVVDKDLSTLKYLGCFSFGLIVMAVIAIWL